MGGNMGLNINDKVKYTFPDPGNIMKKEIIGKISFVGETKTVIECEDNTRLTISVKNYDRITLLDSVPELEEAF
jgi:hypothetical protein